MIRALLSSWGLGTFVRRLAGIRLGRLYQYSPRPLSVQRLVIKVPDATYPSISLVTPSFNQAAFIGRTMHSVLAQEYPKLNYTVQDSMSTDGTDAVLRQYAHSEGVCIYREKDLGQADGLNRGFSRSSGEIMGYLNADDMHLPGTFALIARYFRDNPEVDAVYGNRLMVDTSGQEIGRWILPYHDPVVLQLVDYVPQETLFWRRRIWQRAGASFDTQLHFGLDWDLILRFMACGGNIQHLPELFGLFRVHENQKTSSSFVSTGAEEMVLIRDRYHRKSISKVQCRVAHMHFLRCHRIVDAEFAMRQ